MRTSTLVFCVQTAGMAFLAVSYFFQMLHSVEGISLAVWILVEAFCMFNLLLAIGAYRSLRIPETRQVVWVYILSILMLGADIFAIFLNGTYVWRATDTWTLLSATVAACVIASLTVGPARKGLLSILSKSAPQIVLAWLIWSEGGGGTPATALLAGHFNIGFRVIQVGLSIRKTGWEKNNTWLMVSEIANWTTWMMVSLSWIAVEVYTVTKN